MNPRISVRAFAEMVNLPAHAQMRILTEQKYPRQGPQTFKIPFYQPSLHAIRNYYLSGNDPKELTTARQQFKTLNPEPRKNNNLRVLNAFTNGSQAQGTLTPLKQSFLMAEPVTGVELGLKFDIAAKEAGRDVRIFYNFRNAPLDGQTARLALEIAHWVLNDNSVPVSFSALEYVDLITGHVFKIKRMSKRTTRLMTANAKAIASLWPNL